MFLLWSMIGLMILYIIYAVRGPSIWDRLVALNLISTKVIVIIIAFASVAGSAFMLDFAIIYALSGFIGTIFIALFLADRKLGKRRHKKRSTEREQERN